LLELRKKEEGLASFCEKIKKNRCKVFCFMKTIFVAPKKKGGRLRKRKGLDRPERVEKG